MNAQTFIPFSRRGKPPRVALTPRAGLVWNRAFTAAQRSLYPIILVLTALLCPGPHTSRSLAQDNPYSNVHYLLNANAAPGVVASAQVARGAPSVGSFTAVSVSGPASLQVALARDGQFLETLAAPVTTGMLVGAVYRFRVTNIPFRPGEELYPTVEIIDRVNAPAGREHRFPIPVVLTEEDLRLALDGALVTRVIYIEDSENAEPLASRAGEQRTFNVSASDNALKTADQFGRPVAILRFGSRVPMDLQGDLSAFLYGCPPWIPLPTAPDRDAMIRSGTWPESLPMERGEQPYQETPLENIPRTPLGRVHSASVATVNHEEPVSSPSDLRFSDTLPSDGSAFEVPVSSPTVSFDDASGFASSATAPSCADTSNFVSGCAAGCSGATGCNCGSALPAQRPNAQEYVFDGGDQAPSVVVQKDWTAAGVDPTDTVIYYETLAGKVCVKPSNRVPIYAPRFGAVRQITGIVLAARAVGTERILAPVAPSGFREADLAGNMTLPLAPQGQQTVGMLDAFQENTGGVPMEGVIPARRMSLAVQPHENIEFFTTGLMLDHEIPVLGRVLANARTWYNPESLGVMIDGQVAALVTDKKRAQDVHVYEMPDRCAMRICKAASHSLANPGDTVRFTIRFDNVGPKPLGNAVIMDSLSPRLEYIEGSQQCSVDARFSSDANEVGSLVLRWEIENAVESHRGGVISFDCRVR
ncbi:MAG: DUF11 domain-containing protein [Pirellulaceae bacterium]